MPEPTNNLIEQPVITGNTPGAPNGDTSPTKGTPAVLRSDPKREYVAAGRSQWHTNAARALTWSIDDLTTDLGDDIYERMLRDPHVSACETVFKASILEDGVQIGTAVEDEDGDGYDQAKELVSFVERVLDDLSPDLDSVLWDMLSAISLGNRVAEEVYHLDSTYTGREQLVLQALKVKPRDSTAFVVDSFNNVIGLTAMIPGQGFGVQAGSVLTKLDSMTNLLPREKFAVLSFRQKNHDPRGSSFLRTAYTPWWAKQQAILDWLKYLARFASPSVIGYTAEGAEEDAEGTTPEQAMLTALLEWANGIAAAFPAGSKVDVIKPDGGSTFYDAFNWCDGQITTAILTQKLATQEAEHATRAQAQVHQDVLGTIIKQAKRAVCRMLRRDVLRQMIRFNYGDKLLPLVPKVTLGEVEQEDISALMTSISGLHSSGWITPSQMPALDLRMGLPQRTEGPEEMAAIAAAKAGAAQSAMKGEGTGDKEQGKAKAKGAQPAGKDKGEDDDA